MGKISQGILGGFSGKVGNVIGGSWKGIDYIRIKPANVANPRTTGQVNQRTKFTTTLEFLQAVKPFIQVGYKSLAIKKTAFNAAMSYVLNNAITGTEPNFVIDYPNALVSKGNLSNALNPAMDLATANEVTFSWDDNSDQGNANTTDKSMLLIYNPSQKESIVVLSGATRQAGTQTVSIPATYSGETVEVYMAFISDEGSVVSNSSYIGSGVAN